MGSSRSCEPRWGLSHSLRLSQPHSEVGEFGMTTRVKPTHQRRSTYPRQPHPAAAGAACLPRLAGRLPAVEYHARRGGHCAEYRLRRDLRAGWLLSAFDHPDRAAAARALRRDRRRVAGGRRRDHAGLDAQPAGGLGHSRHQQRGSVRGRAGGVPAGRSAAFGLRLLRLHRRGSRGGAGLRPRLDGAGRRDAAPPDAGGRDSDGVHLARSRRRS